MSTTQASGLLLVVGSLVFFVGAAIGVPGVFTQSDPDVRVRMLEARVRSWVAAQPLYGSGAMICAVGVAVLSVDSDRGTRAILALSSALLFIGSIAWAWSLLRRGKDIVAFARGMLPAWPFASYVLATIAGLAFLGIGLLLGDFPMWLGWLVIAADAMFLGGYLRLGDIPPFVFYVLLLLVGATIL